MYERVQSYKVYVNKTCMHVYKVYVNKTCMHVYKVYVYKTCMHVYKVYVNKHVCTCIKFMLINMYARA